MNQHERCECHDCTQARWRMSMQGQIASAMEPSLQTYLRGQTVCGSSLVGYPSNTHVEFTTETIPA